MIDWIRGEDCAVAIDTGAHPVVIVTWFGTATIELVDAYYRWSDASVAAAIAAEQRLVRIHDVSVASYPPARVCQRAYNHARADLASIITVAHFAVLTDARLRRALGALRWFCGGRRDPELEIVDRIATALELTRERLWAERIPLPRGLDPAAYQRPCLDTSLN